MSNNGQHPAKNIVMDSYTAEAKQDKNTDKATVADLLKSAFDSTGEKFTNGIESFHKSCHAANTVGGQMLNNVSKSKLHQKHWRFAINDTFWSPLIAADYGR